MLSPFNFAFAGMVLILLPLQSADQLSVKRLVGLEYPAIAAQAQIQGDVILQCVIGDDGRVQSFEMTSGPPVLTEAARDNALKWGFHVPKGLGGEARVFRLTYGFRLEGTCVAPTCTSEFSFEYPDRVTVSTQTRHWMPAAAGSEGGTRKPVR